MNKKAPSPPHWSILTYSNVGVSKIAPGTYKNLSLKERWVHVATSRAALKYPKNIIFPDVHIVINSSSASYIHSKTRVQTVLVDLIS